MTLAATLPVQLPPAPADDRDIVLACRNLSHGYASKGILHEINIQVIRGEIVALVGETGCGKSTLLRAILGTHPTRQGEIHVAEPGHTRTRLIRRPTRDCGIVYQHYSLYPYMTTLQNVTAGLMFDQTSTPWRVLHPLKWRKLRESFRENARQLLTKLKLGEACNLYPHELSGGMRQRVAIAQALIMKPQILLLDEPFGALDEGTREELQRMLLELYVENCQAKLAGKPPPYTILIVTHELNEAIYVGDRVIALSRHWGWKKAGHDRCPGATVVYDEMAPVNLPDAERDFLRFAKQRSEIRDAAFNPASVRERDEFQHFWRDFQAGKGEGVLAPIVKH